MAQWLYEGQIKTYVGGFVSLDHIRSRKPEAVHTPEDLQEVCQPLPAPFLQSIEESPQEYPSSGTEESPQEYPSSGTEVLTPSDPDVGSLGSPAEEAHEGSAISETFQSLIDQVIQQHMRELALGARTATTTEPCKPCFLRSTISPYRDNELRLLSKESAVSRRLGPEVWRSWDLGGGNASPFGRGRMPLREVEAGEVLEALDSVEAPSFRRGLSNFSDGQTLFGSAIWPSTTQEQKRYEGLSGCQKVRVFLDSTQYEMAIAFMLFLNVVWMAMEVQVFGTNTGFLMDLVEPLVPPVALPAWKTIFHTGDVVFNSIFALDVVVRILVLGRRFWKVYMNYIDVLVTLASVMEMYFLYSTLTPFRSVLFRLLRVGKLMRAVRMVSMSGLLSSLHLLIKCLASSRDMLFWSFLLLAFVQCVAGLVVSTLCQEFIEDPSQDRSLRAEVYRHYGTFSRTFLTMFEILFANWSPPCRVLVEHVSEWFSIFFLLYRCVLGFAVLNVVNAVFIQQTMKTANSDEELAFRQKQKDWAMYTKHVKKLFNSMDSSGDGAINFDEFSKLVASPKLKFWMSQLELEYHDLLSLFEFLDNGTGQITLTEFIDGAAKLRGSAKAIDIWRIETKVELLFEEVLSSLASASHHGLRGGKSSTVEDAFANSDFRHIKSTRHARQSGGELAAALDANGTGSRGLTDL